MDNMSPALRAAWDRYRDLRERLREHIFSTEPTSRPETHASAVQVLLQNEAIAYEHVIAWRADYPRFSATWGDPMFFDVWKPCADFKYLRAFLDGRRTYRIWGKRGTTLFCDLQHRNRYYSDAGPQNPLQNFNVDDWLIDGAGNFEVIASATPPAAGHWLPLDPASSVNHLMTREAFVDWDRDVGTTMHVARIDPTPAASLVLSEAEMIARLDGACNLLTYTGANYNEAIFLKTWGFSDRVSNTFGAMKHAKDSGAHPDANYVGGVFDLRPGQALIFEFDVPQCAYWGAHLADPVNRTIDYTYHQSSLNNAQARPDGDGRMRMVICARDPGVQNWLDPVGNPRGVCQLRFYKSPTMPVPSARTVAFDSLRDSLPVDTAYVTPQARQETLRRRTTAVMNRYNF